MTDPPSHSAPATSGPWTRLLVWGERLLMVGVLAFVVVRLGPQVGALTGVAPDRGAAPAFSLTTLDGATVASDSLRGRVVVVNFWATWCGPCRLEMPSLQALAERHDPNDVVVLGLSVDAGPGPVRDFLEERGITYSVGMATNAHRRAFGGIPGIPSTFLVDRAGVVRHRVVGYFAPPALNVAVDRLVDEVAPERVGGRAGEPTSHP